MRTLTVAVALVGLVGAGCRKECPPESAPTPVAWALVEYRTGAESGRAPKVEISKTKAYDDFRTAKLGGASPLPVGIRLPEQCLNEAVSQVSGVTKGDKTIFQTTCGVWLAEIERALARTNFRVISWDVLHKREKQKGLSTYEAAKELGAEVVFVFNTLETGELKAGGKVGTTFKYFASDHLGQRGQPLALDDATRAQMRDYAAKSAGGAPTAARVVALSATLDSTAIVTSTGESFWFYRRTVTIPTEATSGMRFLFARTPMSPWQPARPYIPQVMPTVARPNVATEDVSASEIIAEASDPFAAEKLQLVREGAADFVRSFREGTGSSEAK